jgi:hypothetical protein
MKFKILIKKYKIGLIGILIYYLLLFFPFQISIQKGSQIYTETLTVGFLIFAIIANLIHLVVAIILAGIVLFWPWLIIIIKEKNLTKIVCHEEDTRTREGEE